MSNLIVSPHLDDAVLSMGGILLLLKNQRCKVITVFNTAWSIDSDFKDWKEITERNLAEEKSAMVLLKCDFQFLDFPEALLRGYKKWNDILNINKDMILLDEIVKKISFNMDLYTNIYLPKSIGSHVDHTLINEMRNESKLSWTNIFFYEDLPYSCYEKDVRFNDMMEVLVDISSVFERKIELLNLYKTQINDEQIKMVKEHALDLGKENHYYERLWKPI